MMESDTVIYRPGETVWVKISNCPWWPAEVVCENDCPFESEFKGKKTAIAVIKFLNEDYYDFIYSQSKIQPFLVPNYEELKVKAEKDKRESIRTKIGPAFRIGLERVGQLPAVEESQAKPDSEPSSDPNQRREQDKDHPQTTEASKETEELGRGSRKRKQVEKFIARLPDIYAKLSQRGKKRRTVSTGSLNTNQAKSRNCSFSDITNSPTIPYPQGHVTKEKGAKSSVVSRLDVQNSLGAAVKRSLEVEYVSSASLSSTDDTFPAESVGVQFPSPGRKHTLLGHSRGLQIKHPRKRKFLSDDLTGFAYQGKGQLGDPSEDSDTLDSLVPGQDHIGHYDDEQDTSVLFSRCSSSVSSYDSNLDSEASESDEELPEGLSPSVVDSSGMPAERDVVWVKYRHFPFWPAVVRRIQHASRGKRGPKKIQIQFLGHTGHFKENFYVSYRKDVVLPLDNPRRKEFEDLGRECQDAGTRKRFLSSLMEVEAYLNKKALGLLPPSKEDSFFDEDYESDIGETRPTEETCQSAPAKSLEEKDRLSMPDDTNRERKERRRVSNPLEMMKEKRKKKNQVLLEYILSEDMKNYLSDIFKGQRKCDRHTQYHSSIRERDKLRHSGFGPIADEDQQDKITYTFVEWYKDCATSPVDIDYILDVWVPEALVYSIIKKKGYGRSRAWKVFSRGCRLYKIERRQIHQHLIETARNISPADARRYNERLQERMAMTLAS